MSSTYSAPQVQALFDRIAPVYDQLNDWLSLGQHRIWKQMTVKWCEPPVAGTCLDVCCGSGDLTRLLAKQVGNNGQVFGLDFSTAQLAIARQHSDRTTPTLPITWVEGDALNLPFADQQFDAVTMGYGLRNVIDIPGSLKELYRVLKPGAKVAILDLHRPDDPQARAFQQWYLKTIVVPIAQHLGLRDEYAYINPSLEKFPTGAEQVHLAQDVGFQQATHYAIAGGVMGVLVAQKGA